MSVCLVTCGKRHGADRAGEFTPARSTLSTAALEQRGALAGSVKSALLLIRVRAHPDSDPDGLWMNTATGYRLGGRANNASALPADGRRVPRPLVCMHGTLPTGQARSASAVHLSVNQRPLHFWGSIRGRLGVALLSLAARRRGTGAAAQYLDSAIAGRGGRTTVTAAGTEPIRHGLGP